MEVLLHVLIALSTLAVAAFAAIAPSGQRIRIANIGAALTVASGTILVVVRNAPLLKTCITGLAFLAIVYTFIAIARSRLAGTN